MQRLFTLSLILGLVATFAVAQTTPIGCLATTSSLTGSYTFIATELPLTGVTINPPGSTTNYSNTAIGNLVGDVTTGTAFSTSNVLSFDGNGNILVASASAPLYPSTKVGTYTVNADCTINVTLTDVFNTATSGAGISTPTNNSVNLIGLIMGGGTEIDLSVAQSSTSTNGNMPVIAGQFDSRLFIQLVRTFNYGCSSASLTGSYGLIGTGFALANSSTTSTGTGTTGTGGTGTGGTGTGGTGTGGTGTGTTGTGTTTTGTTQPIVFFASVTFDGNGNVVAQTASPSSSPLSGFNYSGTYSLNMNCSGTMTIKTNSSTSATSGTGTTGTGTTGTGTTGTGTTGTSSTASSTLTLNFVVIPPVTYAVNGSAILNGNADRPSLLFTAQSSTETISGYGRAQ